MTFNQKLRLGAAILVIISLLIMSSISDFHTPRDYKGLTDHYEPPIIKVHDLSFTKEIERLNK